MKEPVKGMTFAEVVAQAREIVGEGKYHSISVERSVHHDGAVEIAWNAYVEGLGFTHDCDTPEEMLAALRKKVNGEETKKSDVESIGVVS